MDTHWMLERVQASLREEVRERQGRKRQPSAAIIDSQSVTSTPLTYARGFDGGKKVTGRKRQLLVDTCGYLLVIQVHPAGIGDGSGARGVLTQAQRLVPTQRKRWADSVYNAETLTTWLAEHWLQLDLEIVRRAEAPPASLSNRGDGWSSAASPGWVYFAC